MTPVLVEYGHPMSRFPGAEIGADELPDEIHRLADRIESITGKDVYFIDARRHRFDPGQLPPGVPPPPVSGPPAGPDIVVFVNPDVVDPRILAHSLRRFLIQTLLVWEGYPMAGLRPTGLEPAVAAAVGPMQHWLHLGLLGAAAELRLAALTGGTPEARQSSRLPPFRLPPPVRKNLVDFECAMGMSGSPDEARPDARAITAVLQEADVGSAVGFRVAFGRILDLWGVRQHVMLGVADKESGAISEVPW